MRAREQFKNGLNLTISITGISRRKACMSAGVNEVTLRRFLQGKTDIRLDTLDDLCQLGFGKSLDYVYHLGGE